MIQKQNSSLEYLQANIQNQIIDEQQQTQIKGGFIVDDDLAGI